MAHFGIHLGGAARLLRCGQEKGPHRQRRAARAVAQHALFDLFFLPAILSAEFGLGWFDHTLLATAPGTWEAHALVVLKSAIVLTSWIFGYFGMKHLPITIVGPINATRPVMVLVGAFVIFGERLNAYQWTGVALALVSLFLLAVRAAAKGSSSPITSGFCSSPWRP